MSENAPLRLGAILYPGFEMLDLFGPLEMFSILGREKVEIVTVAEKVGPVAAAIGLEGAVGPKTLADRYRGRAPSKSRIENPVNKFTGMRP